MNKKQFINRFVTNYLSTQAAQEMNSGKYTHYRIEDAVFEANRAWKNLLESCILTDLEDE